MTLFSPHDVQAPTLVDPAGETGVSVLQSLHEVLPRVFLYVPAGHIEHLSAFQVYPVLHKQLVLVMSGAEFDAHNVQSPSPVDPIGEIELPVPQILHKALPSAAL